MASRPLVLPESFNGEGKWEEWVYHYENVADVNGWDDDEKLKWMKVRLTGRAQTALQRLPEASRASYDEAKKALHERFEPRSRQTRYQAEFQTRRKKTTEGWADFAEDIKGLVDQAYPSFSEEAKERLAVNHYLQQLSPPQVAFSVRQKRPSNIDDAVATTLEMESYLLETLSTSTVAGVEVSEDTAVATVHTQVALTSLVEKLIEKLEQLENRGVSRSPPPVLRREPRREAREREPNSFQGKCWHCGRRGHRASECRMYQQSGN